MRSVMTLICMCVVLCTALVTHGVLAASPPHAAPQELQFSVYIHDKETKIVTGAIDKVNANAYGTYNFNSSVAGWNKLEISANKNPSTSEAHLQNIYAMGFAEGYASCNEIHTFWPNFYHDLFGDLTTPPGAKTLQFIKEQWEWMGEQITQHAETDAFWYAQQQTRHQLQGMLDGYKRANCVSRGEKFQSQSNAKSRTNSFWATLDTPTLEHFLLINAWGDMYQITVKMKEPGQLSRLHGKAKNTLIERCSAFIKLLPGNTDVFFGHNTWDSYQSLGPRIFKKYHFPLWVTGSPAADANAAANTALVQYTTLFSSSPALLSSIDDFFVVKGKGHMGVQETTNSLYNLRLLNTIRPSTALSWQRSTAANQLSANGKEWASNFATDSSGTYTNQWMVLDFNKFTPNQSPAAGFFVVYEEVPGLFHSEDMTSTLIEQSFWSSYNNPFFSDIRVASGYQKLCDAGISGNCYDQAPRSVIFKQQQASVTDLTSMQHIMRYNQWQTDAASDGDSCHTVACRGDLETNSDNIGAFGALDAKISSVMLNKSPQTSDGNSNDGCNAYAILGPTQQDQPVFCWSGLTNETNYSHFGQPDCYDFSWVVMQ